MTRPQQIDLGIAAAQEAARKPARSLDILQQNIRRRAGQTIPCGTSLWTGTWDEALESATPAQSAEWRAALSIHEHAQNEIRLWSDFYEGWSRFFLVQNVNGHIHKDMNCSTCVATTQFAWLPELSGMTEADAVEAHGEILCSVCFPSAPVAWTQGVAKAVQVARDEREAAKAARAATKAAKALYADSPDMGLRVDNETLKTIAATKAYLTDSIWWQKLDGSFHPSYTPEGRALAAAALALRLGTTVEAELAAAAKRASKRS